MNPQLPPPVPQPSKRKLGGCAIAFLVLFGLVVVGSIIEKLIPEKTAGEKAADSVMVAQENQKRIDAEAALPNAVRDLSIVKDSWEKGGFGSVALHHFTIVNKSKVFTYKDVEVKLHYFGSSGTEISDSDKVVFEVIPAGKGKRVKELNGGFINQQVGSANVEITGAKTL